MQTYEKHLEELKFLNDQKKIQMEDRLERLFHEKKLLALQLEMEKEATSGTKLQEHTLKELQQLAAQVRELKKQKKEESLELQRQRDEAL